MSGRGRVESRVLRKLGQQNWGVGTTSQRHECRGKSGPWTTQPWMVWMWESCWPSAPPATVSPGGGHVSGPLALFQCPGTSPETVCRVPLSGVATRIDTCVCGEKHPEGSEGDTANCEQRFHVGGVRESEFRALKGSFYVFVSVIGVQIFYNELVFICFLCGFYERNLKKEIQDPRERATVSGPPCLPVTPLCPSLPGLWEAAQREAGCGGQAWLTPPEAPIGSLHLSQCHLSQPPQLVAALYCPSTYSAGGTACLGSLHPCASLFS